MKPLLNTEQQDEDGRLLEQIEERLLAGLVAEVEPRAYSHQEVLQIVARLNDLEEDDIHGKLVVAGFTPDPYGDEDDEQACETCMYYKVHRRFCELPELMLPVKPKWSCRLWRI